MPDPHLHLVPDDTPTADSAPSIRVLTGGRISGARSRHEERKREQYTALVRRWRMAVDNGAHDTTLSLLRALHRWETSVGPSDGGVA